VGDLRRRRGCGAPGGDLRTRRSAESPLISHHGTVHLGAFLAVAVVVIVTPGVDMALVTRNALLYGRRAAVMSALGINLGIFFWVMAAALGLAAIVATSATAFAVIKLAGALYLIYLGIQALRSRSPQPSLSAQPRPRNSLRQGVVSNLLNPKIAVFFTSLLPQFVGTDGTSAQLLLLGLLFNAMGVVWLLAYATAAARARNALARPRVRRGLDRISGIVLIGLGARLALERR
jgi:RhtB (resistance to homoserine/threonine) family protein